VITIKRKYKNDSVSYSFFRDENELIEAVLLSDSMVEYLNSEFGGIDGDADPDGWGFAECLEAFGAGALSVAVEE
jgi:hypothetical protein